MLSLTTNHNDPEARLGWGERLGYGAGGFGINLINAIIGSFLTIYLTNVAFLDAGIIATLFAISRVFDGVSDLIVGRMVDRTKSKFGKARVWLLRMCIPFAVTSLLLFFVPESFPNIVKYIYVFLMYNIVNTICLTTMMVPFFSMVSLITKNSYETGLLGNIQQIFGILGQVFVNAVFVGILTKFSNDSGTIYTQKGFTIAVAIMGIIMLATTAIAVFSTRERVTNAEVDMRQEDKTANTGTVQNIKALLTNKYWMQMIIGNMVIFFVVIFNTIGSIYYAQYVFSDSKTYAWLANATSIAQFAIMLITPFLMKKMPKHVIYTIGMGIMAVGYLGFGMFGTVPSVMILFNAFKGLGLGISGAMALGMMADSVEYGRLKTGIDAIGMGIAGMSAAQKLGMGLGTAVFGWVLSGAGFDAQLDVQGIAQPDSVIFAIKFVYNWVPFILTIIVFFMFLFCYRNIEKDIKQMKE